MSKANYASKDQSSKKKIKKSHFFFYLLPVCFLLQKCIAVDRTTAITFSISFHALFFFLD